MKKQILCIISVIAVLGLTAQHYYDVSSAMETLAQGSAQPIIVIDAGHGGIDGGAVSCSGAYESQLNLQISLRLNDLLRLLGYRTRMIRTEDVSVYTGGQTIAEKKVSDLKERVRLVNSLDNCVLISIHQNSYPDSQYSGAQVFYAKGSDKLAQLLQSQFASTINRGSKRRCKQASGVYLMEQINCTGVLIECGFLSNPEEENLLRNESYQMKICCVIASGLSQYGNIESVA